MRLMGWVGVALPLSVGACNLSNQASPEVQLEEDGGVLADVGTRASSVVTVFVPGPPSPPPDAAAPMTSGVLPPPPVPCSVKLDVDQTLDLRAADDADGDCSNGLQTEINAVTNAGNGGAVTLVVGGEEEYSAPVSGGRVTFPDVNLKDGAVSLRLLVDGQTECVGASAVAVRCTQPPTCALLSSGGVLSGVPTADGGPRVSPEGLPYQTSFTVETDLPDGSLATVAVDGTRNVASATVTGGRAVFGSVTLGADGEHQLVAECLAGNGAHTESEPLTVNVDTSAPDLEVLPPLDAPSYHFSPDLDADPATEVLDMELCAGSATPDVGSVDALCASVLGGNPVCSTFGSEEAGRGCVRVQCPGSATFDLTLTLSDEAGNRQSQSFTGLTCASSSPTVTIANIKDASGAPDDLSRRLLAAGSGGPFQDADADRGGAQTDVTVCSNAADGIASLLTGTGGALLPLGEEQTLTPASSTDGCGELMWATTFKGVTLPESPQTAGALSAMTQLQAEVVDLTTEVGSSPMVSLWVDSIAPTFAFLNPSGAFCGATFRQTGALTQPVVMLGSSFPMVARVNGLPEEGTPIQENKDGVSEVALLSFPLGTNILTLDATEGSGNTTSLSPGEPCVVTVGEPPIVNWQAPAGVNVLRADTDGDAEQAGWQGELAVDVTEFDAAAAPGKSITFYYDLGQGDGRVELGEALIVGDASGGTATLAVTLPEGATVRLSAEMEPVDAFNPMAPVQLLAVDVSPPEAVAALTAIEVVRRGATYQLTWDAPEETGTAIVDYEVYWATSAIDETNLAGARSVPFVGDLNANPAGTLVRNLPLETPLYFAVRAMDAGNNLSALSATSDAVESKFNTWVLQGAEGDVIGTWVNGLGDVVGGRQDGEGNWLQGDGIPDLFVGSWGGKAMIYRGLSREEAAPDQLYADTPSVTFTGSVQNEFGDRVSVIGDVNADGRADLAVSGTYDGPFNQGAVYVWFGRPPSDNTGSEWPSQLSSASADLTIRTPGGEQWGGDCSICTEFGTSVAPVGDFNGDSIDDFVVTAYRAGINPLDGGYAAVILGSADLGGTIVMAEQFRGQPATGVISIPGPQLDGRLGSAALGMGPFYGPNGNGLMIAGANADRLYTFTNSQVLGTPGKVGLIETRQDEMYLGFPRKDFGNALALLGRNRFLATSHCDHSYYQCSVEHLGFVELFYGTLDPFASALRVADTGPDYDFGVSVQGSAVTTTQGIRHLPLVGDLDQPATATDSDFAVVDQGVSATNRTRAPSLHLFSGHLVEGWIEAGQAVVDVAIPGSTSASLSLEGRGGLDFTTQPWSGTAANNTPAADVDGDGYAELVISEFGSYVLTPAEGGTRYGYPGRVIVLW